MNKLQKFFVSGILGLLLIDQVFSQPGYLLTSSIINDESMEISIDLATLEDRYFDPDDKSISNDIKQVQWLGRTGDPDIPWFTITALLPPDIDPAGVNCFFKNVTYRRINEDSLRDISPVPPPVVWADGQIIEDWPADVNIIDGKNTDIYSGNVFWPAKEVKVVSISKMRKWNLITIAVPMLRYNPVSKETERFLNAEIQINYPSRISLQNGRFINVLKDNIGKERVKKNVINFDQFSDLYNGSAERLPSDISAATGYIIITTNNIVNSSSKLADFVAYKQALGFDVSVITEAEFGGGTGDIAAENIRTWLQNNYIAMNIEYVLLIGNPNPSNGDIAMKMLWPRSHSDTYRESPSDYYYADLTGNWDLDGDGLYGETDDFGAGGIDLAAEVLVGRIPYYGSIDDLDHILDKTILYEATQATADWRQNILLPMKPSDASTPGYHLGESIKYNFAEPNSWGSHRIYDETYGLIPPPETTPTSYTSVSDIWENNPFGLVVWWTHGSSTSASSIMTSANAALLNDNYPSFTFQVSCHNSYPEVTNNLSYALLKNGGINTIGATRVSWYFVGQTVFVNSPSNSGMSYEYSARIIDEGMTAGEALYDLKYVLSSGLWMNKTVFNIYGDPSLDLAPFLGNRPPIVNAGQDTTFYWPQDTTSLSGSVFDDGLPDTLDLVHYWQVVSGPGEVLFADTTDLNTQIKLSVFGDYLIQLIASDGEFIVRDTLKVEYRMPASDIELSKDTVYLGTTFINIPKYDFILIHNNGTATLFIDSISNSNARFTVSLPDSTTEVGETTILFIEYSSATTQKDTGIVSIYSNDPVDSVVNIVLYGESVLPPVITVTPDFFDVSLFAGDTHIEYLTIDNTAGGSELIVKMQVYNSSTYNIEMSKHENMSVSSEILNTDNNLVVAESHGDSSVLVIQDNGSWGIYMGDVLINNFNIYPTVINSTSIDTINLDNYDLVITVGAQSSSYYNQLTNNISKFEQYVSNGGIIQYQTATMGANVKIVNNIDVQYGYYENYNDNLYPDHPILFGLPDSIYGNWANHCYFSNLPLDIIILTQTSSSNMPTTIEYTYGKGRVIATGMTWEYLYYYNYPGGNMLINSIGYSLSMIGRNNWIEIPISYDTIQSGGLSNYEVVFNARNLYGGDYNAFLTIRSNDPINPEISIPAHMDVTGVPFIELSADTIDFGTVMIDSVKTESLIISNTGTDSLMIDSIFTTNSKFSVDQCQITIPAGDYAVLQISYHSSIPAVDTSLMTIINNSMNDSISIIKLIAHAVTPPLITVTPDSFDISLYQGENLTEFISIENNGGFDLSWNINAESNVSYSEGELISIQDQEPGLDNSSQPVSNNLTGAYPNAAGDFILKASSPGQLTCMAVDPETDYIYAQHNNGNIIYRYDPSANSWDSLAYCPINSGNNGGATIMDGKMYSCYTGLSSFNIYSISDNTWDKISQPSGTGNITNDGIYIYTIDGTSFRRLDPNTLVWSTLSSSPISFQRWGGLAYHNGYIYGHSGDGTTSFAKYNISTDTWTTLPSVPGGAVLGCAIDPFHSKYYAYGSYEGYNWYEFDMISESWNVATIPFFAVFDGGMCYVNNGIYFIQGERGYGFGFFDTGNWINFETTHGNVPPGSSVEIPVEITSEGLEAGEYEAIIRIYCNDPLTPITNIPVDLTISTPGPCIDETFTARSGELSDNSGPEDYTSERDCRKLIEPSGAATV
ncbi:MAG: choice-of-anchor D domain-containing protein, partial [Bacteroidales bacterium]|nr:choice-of-anchor D domain-containing protein [Bacteroidales bacterium]